MILEDLEHLHADLSCLQTQISVMSELENTDCVVSDMISNTETLVTVILGNLTEIINENIKGKNKKDED